MPPVGFEPTISAGERPQTHALDRAATGTGRTDFVAMGNTRLLMVHWTPRVAYCETCTNTKKNMQNFSFKFHIALIYR